MFVRTFVLLVTFTVCLGFAKDTGRPKAADPGPSFDPVKYQGQWHEIVRSRNLFFEGKETTDRYMFNSKEQNMKIKVSMQYFGRTVNLQATATWHHDVPNVWAVRPDCRFFNRFSFNYTVLDTDYDNYSVVYSANRILNRWIIDAVWIIARSPDLSHDLLAHAITVVEKNTHFRRDDLIPVR